MMRSPRSKLPNNNDGGPSLTKCDIGQYMKVKLAMPLARPMATAPPNLIGKNPIDAFSTTPKLVSTPPKSFREALIHAKIRDKPFDSDVEDMSDDYDFVHDQ
ncbi:hypothetical protein U1Q18_019962 [Sarracenia purpurea var. burkii]